MLRSICLLVATLVWTTTANAASLAVSPDKLTYNVGETITLTVTGDDEGASAYAIFGRLDYSGSLVDNGTRSQIALHAAGAPFNWNRFTLNAGDDGINAFSDAFNQLCECFDAQSPENLPAAFATVTLIATAVGIVDVDWHTVNDGFQLTFFGLTDAPGTSFTIVPEPATAALFALGLLGLAATRRTGGR
jgi:hypothetical protein